MSGCRACESHLEANYWIIRGAAASAGIERATSTEDGIRLYMGRFHVRHSEA